MMLQAKGGLHRSEIEGIYPESQKDKATKHAEMLIEAEATP
jgi:hypothetical protein